MEWSVIASLDDLRRVLRESAAGRHDQPLGQVLLDAGLIDPSRLTEMLARQKEDRTKPLGRVLTESGLLGPAQINEALAVKCGIPRLRLEGFPIPAEVAALVSPDLAIRHRVMPLADIHGVVIVAMENPFDAAAIDLLRFNLSLEITPVMVPTRDLALAHARYYSGMEGLDTDTPEPEPPAGGDEDEANRRPIVRLADAILRQGILRRASDINIRPVRGEIRVYYRIDGRLQYSRSLNRALLPALVSRIKIIGRMNIAERRLPQEGNARLIEDGKGLDLRISIVPTVHGESVVVRILDREQALRPLAELGLPVAEEARIRSIIAQPHGLFLVTGPTGSGKSTTLSAVLAELQRTEAHILTAEDPVEYDMEGIEQVQVAERIGLSFAEVLRRFLRHDPDIIMVGEIRDRDTARMACQAALTGHFVLSTLHTNDAPSAVARLFDMGVEPYILASTLRGVMAQRLVRLYCPRCRGAGCAACGQSGFAGRRMVCEVFEVDAGAAALIANGASTQQLAATAERQDMVRLAAHARRLAAEGMTSMAEALEI